MPGGLVLAFVDQVVKQRVQASDPRKVGLRQRLCLAGGQSRPRRGGDQRVYRQRGSRARGGLPPLQVGAWGGGLSRPLLQPGVIALRLAQVQALEGDDPLGRRPRPRTNDVGAGQTRKRRAAFVEDAVEKAAVPALGVKLVPVEPWRALAQRVHEPFVQPPAIADGVGARLLAEQVEQVIGALERACRLYSGPAVAPRRERGEGGRALHVAALAQRLDR